MLKQGTQWYKVGWVVKNEGKGGKIAGSVSPANKLPIDICWSKKKKKKSKAHIFLFVMETRETNLWTMNSICISFGVCFQRCICYMRQYIFTWTGTRMLKISFKLLTTIRHRKVGDSRTRSLICKSVIIRMIAEPTRTKDNTTYLSFVTNFIWTRLPGQCSSLFSISSIFILVIIWRTLRIWVIGTGTPCIIFNRTLQ